MKHQGRKIANSFYLPRHPFLRGIASLVDFQGTLNRDTFEQIRARSDAEAKPSDAEAIRTAWEAVGDSMRSAIQQYKNEINMRTRS